MSRQATVAEPLASSDTRIVSVNLDQRPKALEALGLRIQAMRPKPIAILVQDVNKLTLADLVQRTKSLFDCDTYKYKLFTNDQSTTGDDQEAITRDTMILARTDISPEPCPVPLDIEFCAMTGVDFKMDGIKGKIPLFSVYIRPSAKIPDMNRALEFMINESRKRQTPEQQMGIYMGDFNAHSPEWMLPRILTGDEHADSTQSTQMAIKRGRTLSRFLGNNSLQLMNRIEEGPSFVGPRGSSTVDLVLVGTARARVWNYSLLEPLMLGPGETASHRLVILGTKRNVNHGESRIIYRPGKLDERHFRELRNEVGGLTRTDWTKLRPADIEHNMERLASKLEKALRAAMRDKKVQIRTQVTNERFTNKTERIRNLLKNLTKARENRSTYWKYLISPRTRKEPNAFERFEQIKRRVVSLEKTAKRSIDVDARVIEQYIRQQAAPGLSVSGGADSESSSDESDAGESVKPAPVDASLDQRAQRASIESFLERTYPAMSREYGINAIRNYRRSVCSGQHSAARCSCMPSTTSNSSHFYSTLITDFEVAHAVESLANKHHLGADKISHAFLAAAYKFVPEIINTICKQSFYLAASPASCRKLAGELVPKSDGSFRLLHKSSTLATLLETIAARRLAFALASQSPGLDTHQYAFVPRRDRHDLVARIMHHVFQRKASLVTYQQRALVRLFKFDVQAAFDTVDHKALCEKLFGELKPEAVRFWLANYMIGRKVEVTLPDGTIRERYISRGLAQGSVLAPILFNWVVSRIGSLTRGDKTRNHPDEFLLFADDIFLIGHGGPKTVQKLIDALVAELAQYGLCLNPNKSRYIMIKFGACFLKKSMSHPFQLNQMPITVSAVGFDLLGVRVDEKFHIDEEWLKQCACEKVALNARRLFQMKRLGLIRGNSAWRLHIQRHIFNLLTPNLFPYLAIRRQLRETADLMMARAIRAVFRWSPSVSPKLMRLILRMPSTEHEVRKWLHKKLVDTNGDHYAAYRTLEELFQLSRVKRAYERRDPDQPREKVKAAAGPVNGLTYSGIVPLPPAYSRPFIWDPAMILNGPHELDIGRHDRAQFWMLIDGAESSTAVLIGRRDAIMEQLVGRHSERSSAYYHALAILHHLSGFRDSQNILFNSNSALLKALLNYDSHDWWIIELRLQLICMNWSVHVAPDARVAELRERIKHKLNPIEPINLYFPDPGDWDEVMERNHELVAYEALDFDSNHTTVTRAICPDYDAWACISPAELNSKHFFRLAGMFFDIDRPAARNGNEPCGAARCGSALEGDQLVLHRLFDCERYEERRKGWLRYKEREARPQMRHTLQSMTHRKKLLDFLYEWPE